MAQIKEFLLPDSRVVHKIFEEKVSSAVERSIPPTPGELLENIPSILPPTPIELIPRPNEMYKVLPTPSDIAKGITEAVSPTDRLLIASAIASPIISLAGIAIMVGIVLLKP